MLASANLVAKLLSKNQLDARSFPWWTLRYEDAQAVRALLAKHYAPSSTNRHIAAMKGALRECWRLRLMTRDQYERAADVQAIRNERPPAGRALSREEVRALFEAAEESNAPMRDSAMLAVAVCCGLRRFEISALDLCDLDPKDGKLTVRIAKGNRSRTVFLPPNALARAQAWLKERGAWIGPLFVSLNKAGRPQRARLSPDGVEFVLQSLGSCAGIAHFSAHDLRRTMISELLDRGVDLVTVQRIAGHKRPETTAKYDRRPDERRREAAALVDVPLA
jgi:integrase